MIPLTRPTLPRLESLHSKLQDIFHTGMITDSKYVDRFEKKCVNFLGARWGVAVNSGTSALILILKLLELRGEVILSSFTFTSGGHALLWCGLEPVFVDIDLKTFNIDSDQIEKKITPKTSAILATHVFGNPCEIEKIQRIAKKYNLKVIYDAAHAFGSKYKGKSVVHFGHASIFSFTPTKVITTGEGGLIVVKNKKLARLLKLGRNNGDSFNRKEEFLGISARMPELNAILGIKGLEIFKEHLKRRLIIVNLYKNELANIPGISFQDITPNSFSVYRDFVILVDKKRFGISRDDLLKELLRRNIQTKVYFDPPLHRKKVYSKYRNLFLPHTNFISKHIMNLPLYSHMPEEYVTKVCSIIKKLYKKNKK